MTVGTEVLGTIINMPAREKAAVRKGDLLVELRADDVRASLREAHRRLTEAEAVFASNRSAPAGPHSSRSPDGKEPQPPASRRDADRRRSPAAMPPRRPSSGSRPRRPGTESSRRSTAWSSCRHADPGETVTAAAPLVTIVDLSRLRVEAEVDEFDIDRSRSGRRETSPPRATLPAT